jgi:hypothetical protein
MLVQVYNIVTLILNKYRKGFVKTSQKVDAIRQATSDFFLDQADIYRATEVIPASLKPLTKTAKITLINGVSPVPGNFSQEVTFQTEPGARGKFFSPEQFLQRVNSYILAPDQANPIAKIEDKKIIVEPNELLEIFFTYIAFPPVPDYKTVVAADQRSETYDPSTSVEIEFPEEYSGEIARRALLYLGVAFQNNEALQLALAEQSNDNQK